MGQVRQQADVASGVAVEVEVVAVAMVEGKILLYYLNEKHENSQFDLFSQTTTTTKETNGPNHAFIRHHSAGWVSRRQLRAIKHSVVFYSDISNVHLCIRCAHKFQM